MVKIPTYEKDGFEDGDFTNNPTWSIPTWDDRITDRAYEEVQTSVVKNGTYAFHWHANSGYSTTGGWERVTAISGSVSSGTFVFDSYMRKSLWVSRSAPKDQMCYWLIASTTNSTIICGGQYINNYVRVNWYNGRETQTTLSLTSDTWTRMEITFTTDGSNTTSMTLKVYDANNTQVFSETHTLDSGASIPGAVRWRHWSDVSTSYGGPGSADMYRDDVTYGVVPQVGGQPTHFIDRDRYIDKNKFVSHFDEARYICGRWVRRGR